MSTHIHMLIEGGSRTVHKLPEGDSRTCHVFVVRATDNARATPKHAATRHAATRTVASRIDLIMMFEFEASISLSEAKAYLLRVCPCSEVQ